MRNINSEINIYREATRHVWNSSFFSLEESVRFGAGLDLYQKIDDLLFGALVCAPLGSEYRPRASLDPIVDLQVVPRGTSDVPIMVNRSIPASGYWDGPVKTIRANDVHLALIGFFDWDEYAVKDCRYYRVRITQCNSNLNLVGKDALIETFYADIFF